MRYPVVLLDVGETLVGPRESFGATYARVLGNLGLAKPAEVYEGALRETWAELSRAVPPGVDRYRHFQGGEEGYWLRFVRGTLERAGGEDAPGGLVEEALSNLRAAFRRKEAWEVYPDVVPALSSLREAGVRMGVVSNWDSRLPSILEMLDLAPYFQTVTVSHFEGVEKPDPEIFHRALLRLGARAKETLHVGDVPELDLKGARAAGIDGVLVDRRGKTRDSPGVLEDLSSLEDLVRHGLPPPDRE